VPVRALSAERRATCRVLTISAGPSVLLGSPVAVFAWSALAASASAVSCLLNLRLCWWFGRFTSTTSTPLARRKRANRTPKLPLPSMPALQRSELLHPSHQLGVAGLRRRHALVTEAPTLAVEGYRNVYVGMCSMPKMTSVSWSLWMGRKSIALSSHSRNRPFFVHSPAETMHSTAMRPGGDRFLLGRIRLRPAVRQSPSRPADGSGRRQRGPRLFESDRQEGSPPHISSQQYSQYFVGVGSEGVTRT
jgi:hypothetical protein